MNAEPAGDDSPVKLRERAIAWREVDGETIVLDMSSSLYLGVNDAGSLLWGELAKGTTKGTLVQRLVDTYGIDAGRAAADVDAFLASCAERDLLEP